MHMCNTLLTWWFWVCKQLLDAQKHLYKSKQQTERPAEFPNTYNWLQWAAIVVSFVVLCTLTQASLEKQLFLEKFRSLFKIIKHFLLLRLVNTLKTVAHVWLSVPQLHSMTPNCCKWCPILTTVWLLETSVCGSAQVSSMIGKCGVRYLWSYAVQQMMPPLCGDTVKHGILNTGIVE